MLDFKELPSDGNAFELLVRELLYSQGLEVYWSGKGADGGKDLLCIERHSSCFKNSSQRWLIQCKHNAHSGHAVSKSDLDSIVDSCAEHNATGYLLVCSTFPTSNLVKRLEEIQNTKGIITQFWDCIYLERELLKPTNWNIANMFFPKSLSACGWNISSIEPSFWYATYKGNIVYIASRIGTNISLSLPEIEKRIEYINQIDLPKGHIMRIRAMYFDDKHTNYKMYLDYLLPREDDEIDEFIEFAVEELEHFEIIDGISYDIDIMTYKYNPYSDSFDTDSNGYYNSFIEVFKNGLSREGHRKYAYSNKKSPLYLTEEFVNNDFNDLVKTLSEFEFIRILKSENSKIEFIDQFTDDFAWDPIINSTKFDIDNFFNANVRFVCSDFDLLVEMLSFIPQSCVSFFNLVKNYIFLPDEGLERDDDIYTLYFTIHPCLATSKYQFRKALNKYLHEVKEKIDQFKAEKIEPHNK